MSRRSFESINYMLRAGKNVERKLIASTMVRLSEEFSVRDYRYVGFGSMWFTDFILMHKVVGINDMVTIEAEKSRAKRVEFNKPFACIDVRMDYAAAVLGEVIEDKPVIVWLDYDGALKNALTGDLETAVGAMSSGSMILVSVNARVDQLKDHTLDDVALTPLQYLIAVCEDSGLANEEHRLTRNNFPQLVAEILHERLKSATLSRNPRCEYKAIWSFWYADDTEMVTVGGMIANKEDSEKLLRCALDEIDYLSPDNLFHIEVPILTEKEKRALDKLLPSQTALEPKLLDFELRQSEISAYQKFYLQYPIFNEISG